jgi:hypothetical protein
MLVSKKNKEIPMTVNYPLGTPLAPKLRNRWLAYEIGTAHIILGVGDTPEAARIAAVDTAEVPLDRIAVRIHVVFRNSPNDYLATLRDQNRSRIST